MYLFSALVNYDVGDHLLLEGLRRGECEFEDCGAEGVVVDSFCFVVLDEEEDCRDPLQRGQQLRRCT